VRPGTDAVLPGGWHERENGHARWTASRAGVWLRLGATVRALVRHGEPDAPPLGIGIAVDRQTIGAGSAPAGTWVEISAEVPPAMRGTVQRVFLDCARTWSPAERGDPNDTRELGVSVQRVWST